MRPNLKRGLRLACAAGIAATLAACQDTTRSTQELQGEAQQLVDRSTLTVQDILAYNQNGGEAQRFLRNAKAVLVCPSIFKMGFVIGGSGGGCTLLARGGRGSWSAPAFYHMGSGSVGAQVGIQDAELVLFILTQKGLRAIEDSQFKFGGDASISIATMGAGMEGATTAALRADIVAVSKSKGLYAGLSLQGSILSSNSDYNRAYYNQPVGAVDIVEAMRVNNPGADPLRSALMKFDSVAPPSYRPAAGSGAATDGGQPMQLAPRGSVQTQSLAPLHR
ncbi:lipid-binding SYLF domain-containing protein [Endobacter medicaginis]|uniref:Lipid-binding SYLF domain-containing protein n=1 Tax=Endobacter medicaginis TaxID=1181271 RepID=A0A850NRH4_9PROT|nr:lipid-binding SYLF domain-containing protein [Endobacter medicaginis]MBB3173558.1 lipid-binding SYLF domain-containing protein [Endobacter medicaginis]MCX5475353.1 lipid-binding SYLF domain-containing protein [Endobacter medicaginis]NVN29982.1 lipid-binding SYLF domain-containing protein [Endobacter medicaginis]